MYIKYTQSLRFYYVLKTQYTLNPRQVLLIPVAVRVHTMGKIMAFPHHHGRYIMKNKSTANYLQKSSAVFISV